MGKIIDMICVVGALTLCGCQTQENNHNKGSFPTVKDQVELRLHPRIHYQAIENPSIVFIPLRGPGDLRVFTKQEGNVYWVAYVDSHRIARVIHVNAAGQYEIHLEDGTTLQILKDSTVMQRILAQAKILQRSHQRVACSQLGVDALVSEGIIKGFPFSY